MYFKKFRKTALALGALLTLSTAQPVSTWINPVSVAHAATQTVTLVNEDNWVPGSFTGFGPVGGNGSVNAKSKDSNWFGILFFEDPKNVQNVELNGFSGSGIKYDGYVMRFSTFAPGSKNTAASFVVNMKDGKKYTYNMNLNYGTPAVQGDLAFNKGAQQYTYSVDALSDDVVITFKHPRNSWDGNMSTFIGVTFTPKRLYINGQEMSQGTDYTMRDYSEGTQSSGYWYREFTIPASTWQSIPNGVQNVAIGMDDGQGINWQVTNSNSPAQDERPDIITDTNTFDFNNKKDLKYGAYLGAGYGEATTVTQVIVDDTTLTKDTEWSWSADSQDVVFKTSYLETLGNGDYNLGFVFDDIRRTVDLAALKVINADRDIDKAPSVVTETVEYDWDNPTDPVIEVSLGSGNLAATDITGVKVGTKVLTADDFELDGTNLKIKGDALKSLANGTHTVTVTFNDDNATEDTAALTIKNKPAGTAPSLITKSQTYDYDNPSTVVFETDFGFGNKRATDIASVSVGSKTLAVNTDYTVSDTTVTFADTWVKTLSNGNTTITFNFNDTAHTSADGTLTVQNKPGEVDTGTAPNLLTASQEYDYNNVKAVAYDVSFGTGDKAATTVTKVSVGSSILTADVDYTITGTTVTINETFIKTKNNGTYTVAFEFDDKDTTIKYGTLVIKNKPDDGFRKPTVDPQTITFDKKNPEDVVIKVDPGDDEVTGVKVGDKPVPDDKWKYDPDKGGIVVDKDWMKDLPDDVYPVEIDFKQSEPSKDDVTCKVTGDDDTTKKKPEMEAATKIYDAENPTNIEFWYKLNSATGIDNTSITTTYEDGVLTVDAGYLATFANGTYTIVTTFDEGSILKCSKVQVINSKVGQTDPGDEPSQGKPPVLLVIMEYEYYKNEPYDVIIPVKLNSATTATEVYLDDTKLPDEAWEFKDFAVVLKSDYCDTLDLRKYWVKIRFDDEANTLVTNATLRVYEDIDVGGGGELPVLIQKYIVFTGQDVTLRFREGAGDTVADGVDALIFDGKAYLPDGTEFTATKSLVKDIQVAKASLEEDEEFEVATPLNARRSARKMTNKQRDIAEALATTAPVFTVNGRYVDVDGQWLNTLGFKPGTTHLAGAVFANSVRTVDDEKVVFVIPKEDGSLDVSLPGVIPGDNPGGSDPGNKPGDDNSGNKPGDDNSGNKPGDNKPGDTDPGNKPGDDNPGNKPGEDNPGNKPGDTGNKPGDGDKPSGGNKPSGGSSGSSGSSGGGGGSSSLPAKKPGYHTDGSYDTGAKPSIPMNQGSFVDNGDGTWSFTLNDGTPAKNRWVAYDGHWFFIDADGRMRTGWYLDEKGDWYVLNKEPGALYGACLYGWYYEVMDGKWYFLHPLDGHMLISWQRIDHSWYFFTPLNGGQTYFGDNVNGWYYDISKTWKPYGSMYANEETPDGYKVNASGVWVQ